MFLLLYSIAFLLYLSVALAVTAALVWSARKLGAGKMTQRAMVVFSAITFVLIPTWDIPVAEREFAQLCQREAGVKINRSVDAVEGFASESFGSQDSLKIYGYKFVEHRNLNKWLRYSLDDQGDVVKQEIKAPSARYRIELVQNSLEYAYKTEVIIEDAQTKERLATKTKFSFRGSWLVKRLRWGAAVCSGNDMDLREFFTKTLNPVHRPR